MNFALDVVDAADPAATALVALDREGGRRVETFGDVSDRAGRLAGTLAATGVARRDIVITLIGNRPEWVHAMVACWRIGAIALPCSEQLRPADLRARMRIAPPRLAIADERNAETLAETGFRGKVLTIPDERLYDAPVAPAVDCEPLTAALIVFTSGTSGRPKAIRHGHGYLAGQRLQAEHWFGARPGELAWCTGATGWSKSARNAFVAPWLCGAAALLQDARFDPAERLDTIEREGVDVLCMAPTEYRAIAKRVPLRPLPSLRHAVAAGEPLNAEVVLRWQEEVGVSIHDGYGQTETGALTAMPLGEPVRAGSMGKALPGIRLSVDEDVDDGRLGELRVDPTSVPTFFLDGPPDQRLWYTGDRVRVDADGYLWFDGRADDVILSAGYRIGPFEVESALVSHPDVAEAAAVPAADEERGQVVRAIVVPCDGVAGSPELARELQEHVKGRTAPYKYPRIVEFADSLPKTASGKIKRADLRA